MAELKVKVSVNKKELQELDRDIKRIQKNAYQIKVDITSATKAINAVKELENANKKLETATQKRIAAEARLDKETAKQTKEMAKLRTEIEKTTREQEKTAQTANRRAAAEVSANAKIVQAEQRTQQEVLKTERAVTKAATAWKNMFSMFSLSNIVSSGITRAISAMRSYFNEALQEMKALDLAATHYQQVMGSATTPEATKAIQSQAYSVGSKYGTSASSYMESVATYARAGYKDVADQLAELSMKTVIVGQTTQEVADQFLLTMDTAYKYGGAVSELSKVLDGASAIDSNYATTIEKIATGLGLVAPLAQQVHTSEAELTAAIGTITAATQRSGAEAARALRSLFLNIIKDTTTEIEDGVTATEESVASIQYLLERYASSAVEAARATGQVINPMEAIGALAESMKEGLLTEAQLMDLLSGIGGKLRISQLVALVSNWKMYTEMLGTYENAMGSADQKTEIYLDSWEAKTNILKNTWTEFVANTINTDFLKGIIDAGTTVLKLINNLATGIGMLVGVIATLKLSSVSKQFLDLSKSAKAAEAGTSALFRTKGIALGWAGAIVGAVTAVISAYNMYHNHRMQQLSEERDAQMKTAEAEKDTLDKVNKAYDVYMNAKKALYEGKLSSEEYETAVRNLAVALGIQDEAFQTNIDYIEQKRKAQHKATVEELEDAIQIAKITANAELNKFKLTGNYRWTQEDAGDFEYTKHLGLFKELDAAKTAEEAIPVYKQLVELQDKYLQKSKKDTEEAKYFASGYDKITDVLSNYAPWLDTIIQLEEELADANDRTIASMSEDEVRDALGATADSAEEAATSFEGLAGAIKKAEGALADYETRTKSEKDDDYKKYAEAWQKAFEDIQAGKRNSNAVNAVADLFFTPEQIMKMRERGIEVADAIGSDFFKSIFTYMDENDVLQFVKGEDSGANLAYKLFGDVAELQEDGSKVIKLGEKVAATFEEVNGELKLNVTDVKMLSEALGQMGIDVDPDFLYVWLEALGVFSDEFIYSCDVVKEFANEVGALKDGKVDLQQLITGQLNLGKSTEEVADLLDAVAEMAENHDVELTVSADEIPKTIEKCKEIIAQREDINKKDADLEVTADTDEAVGKINYVKELLLFISKKWNIDIGVNDTGSSVLDSYLWKLDYISNHQAASLINKNVAKPYAVGTKSASGGLSLVNEEGPELIAENGTARIAGSGKPTLTYLASGATVFNARETRSILGGSFSEDLYDGINAYKDGTSYGYNISGIKRWTPTKGNTSGGNTSGTAVGASRSSSSSPESRNSTAQLDALKNRIELLKSELALMQARGDSIDAQIAKQKEIQQAYQNEINYLISIGGDQQEINKLSTEWWKIEKEIRDMRLDKAKSELTLLEAQNAPIRQQIEKQREISSIYQEQIDYLKQTGGSQTEINKLLKERKDIEEDIAKLNKSLMSDLSDAINTKIDAMNKTRDKFVDGLQKEIDALKEQRDAQEEVNEKEEKHQKLVEAYNNLMNARKERTVRYYNAATGQWEWAADASQLKSAQEAYDSAKADWNKYKEDAAFNAKIDALVAKQDRYTEIFAEKTEKWQEVLESMQDPVMTIAQALKNIEKNATKDMRSDIDDLNKLLQPLGYSISTKNLYDSGGILSGIGGIKATYRDEAVLPPDITEKLLKPIQPAVFEQRLNELRYLYGANGMNFAGSIGNSIGSQHNGDLYTFGNVTLTTEQAKQTTMYDFVQAAKSLRTYSGRM